MFSLDWPTYDGRVIELMAGYGRNYGVYNSLFNHFEMLDGCRDLTRLIV